MKFKRSILSLVILSLLFVSSGLMAQQSLNLDFEMPSVEGLQRPWGWALTAWGTSYFAMDSTFARKGKYSLHSKCSEEKEACAKQSLSFDMEIFELKSKAISVAGFIKGRDLEKAVSFSVVYTQYDKLTGEYIDQEVVIKSKELSQSSDWQRVSVNLTVPPTVAFIKIWMNHEGAGEAWFDDFQLAIEGQTVEELQIAETLTKSNIAWLAEHATPFQSPLPISSANSIPEEDLSFFKEAVGSSTIIALGESTHGTSEFFSLKHKLLQYAVTELGFRVFAIEDHQLVGEQINEYVKTGKGTLGESMADCFNVWAVEEVVEMIRWIREYNKAHPKDMISFIGFDIQNITPSIDHLSDFLKQQDVKFYTEHLAELKYLKEKGESAFMVRDSVQKLEWIDRSKKLYEQIIAHKEKWLSEAPTKTDRLKVEYGVQYATLVKQYFQVSLNSDEALYRDVAMADNISWYKENIDPEAKIVVWAHDVHISRGEHPDWRNNLHQGLSMGTYLSKRYQEDYKSFGIFTFEGSYRAFKTYAYRSLIDSPLYKSPKGSLEEAMHQVAVIKQAENLFFSLERTEDWFNEPLPIRFANHVSFDYGFWPRYSIPYQFDGIFFIDKTRSAKEIKK